MRGVASRDSAILKKPFIETFSGNPTDKNSVHCLRRELACALWRQKAERYHVRVRRYTDWGKRRVSGAFGNNTARNEWNLCSDA